MEYLLLAFIAFSPAIFYMLYIIAFDHRKPEPLKTLLLPVLLGIITALVVVSLCIDGTQTNSSTIQGVVQIADSLSKDNIQKADMVYKQRKDQSNSGTPDSLSSKMSQMVEELMHGK